MTESGAILKQSYLFLPGSLAFITLFSAVFRVKFPSICNLGFFWEELNTCSTSCLKESWFPVTLE